MKNILRKFLVATSLLLIMTIQVEANVLTPPNVQLLGNANGLVHIPGEDLFLHYPNMLPGDSITRTLEIKNQYEYPYELFIRAKRVSSQEEYDLLNKLDLTITYKDKTIYAGPTSGEYELTDDISLGVFKSGQEETLVAKVNLDGASTGNEYKNKYAEVDWIFTAIRDEESDIENPEIKPPIDTGTGENGGESSGTDGVKPPKTGDPGVLKNLLLCSASVIILLILNFRKKYNR